MISQSFRSTKQHDWREGKHYTDLVRLFQFSEQLSTVNNVDSFDISTVRIDTDDHMASCPAASGLSAEPKLDIVTIDGHLQTTKM